MCKRLNWCNSEVAHFGGIGLPIRPLQKRLVLRRKWRESEGAEDDLLQVVLNGPVQGANQVFYRRPQIVQIASSAKACGPWPPVAR